ncbi:MAG TPA: hypothetical protein VFO34_13635 [Candidatus Acidoferrales bacterium]|nr:hypothetical protein [Candidatus Acidoferrales bacterium]
MTAGLIAGVSLFFSAAWVLQADSAEKPSDAEALVREMVRAETKAQLNDHSLWRYREIINRGGRKETRDVVQTQSGTLDRLVAVDGERLDSHQQQKEDQRVHRLATNSNDLAKAKRETSEDAERERRLLQMLPDAFHYQEQGTEDGLIHLKFSPNPDFRASTREAMVFHHLTGDLWINSQAKRLARISGTLNSEVKFGGGLLGHLNRGGTFSVRQQDVGNGTWEMTNLDVQMSGKALFFHSITVHQTQECSDFRPVNSGITPEQAAAMLKQNQQAEARANPASQKK